MPTLCCGSAATVSTTLTANTSGPVSGRVDALSGMTLALEPTGTEAGRYFAGLYSKDTWSWTLRCFHRLLHGSSHEWGTSEMGAQALEIGVRVHIEGEEYTLLQRINDLWQFRHPKTGTLRNLEYSTLLRMRADRRLTIIGSGPMQRRDPALSSI